MMAEKLQMLQSSSYLLRLCAIDKPNSQLYLLHNIEEHLKLDCIAICALQN